MAPKRTSKKVNCPICGQEFFSAGLSSHQRKCEALKKARAQDKEFERMLAGRQGDAGSSYGQVDQRSSRGRRPAAAGSGHSGASAVQGRYDPSAAVYDEDPTAQDVGPLPEPPRYQQDDMRIEYHPNSKKPPVISSFEDFKRNHNTPPESIPPVDMAWAPFRSRLDFEIAELALGAGLTSEQMNNLIKLIHRSVKQDPNDMFSLTTHKEVTDKWREASQRLSPFVKKVVVEEYGHEDHEFDFYCRDIWDCTMEMLDDKHLFPHIVWDAERLSKYNGAERKRFIDEPWTADLWWDIQSSLPPSLDPNCESVPVCFILYADKTKLSSFGTEMGYPIIMRWANLPVGIRNGDNIGGGQVVGWLPIIDEDKSESGKPSYVNFKRAVWHASFAKFLEAIEDHAKTGFAHECLDEIKRLLWPILLILSADYEEQCTMALIRGIMGSCPCPVCEVPRDQLLPDNIDDTWPLRTADGTESLMAEISDLPEGEKEKILQAKGLRPVKNCFLHFCRSNYYAALCFDPMHANAGGQTSDHLWPQIQTHVTKRGRAAIRTMNEQADKMPRWRNLNHFDNLMGATFTDATKYEDIAKLVIFAAHNILTEEEDPLGYKLLCAFRAYLEWDMYVGLEVHTEDTLDAGQEAHNNFLTLIKEYRDDTTDTEFEKNWNYPKMHSGKHAMADILAKGATRNYNTKPNEKLHGPIKRAYEQTNFKDVAGQILEKLRIHCTAALMRRDLDWADLVNKAIQDDDDLQDAMNSEATEAESHVYIGSKQSPISLDNLEKNMSNDPAFTSFRIKLQDFLSSALQASGIPLRGGRWMQINPDEKIMEHRFIKVNYESMVDWREKTDYLRCNPSFYRRPRYDCVLVHSDQGNFFGKLVFVFTYSVENKKYPVVLLQPLERYFWQVRRKDKDLGFYRLRIRPRKDSIFIFARSIIRGALICEDFDPDRIDEHLVVDVVDSDMFLRMKQW